MTVVTTVRVATTARGAFNLGLPQASSMVMWVGDAPTTVADSPLVGRGALIFSTSEDAYYWTFGWQRHQAETEAALAAGEGLTFDSDDPADAAAWLLSDD
jgi:hypothetical protein